MKLCEINPKLRTLPLCYTPRKQFGKTVYAHPTPKLLGHIVQQLLQFDAQNNTIQNQKKREKGCSFISSALWFCSKQEALEKKLRRLS